MSLLLGAIAWAGIGAIAGFVAPILAGTTSQPHRVRTVGFGAGLAVVAGLAGYLVNSLVDDDADGRFFGLGAPVLFVIVLIALYSNEKRRTV